MLNEQFQETVDSDDDRKHVQFPDFDSPSPLLQTSPLLPASPLLATPELPMFSQDGQENVQINLT